MLSNDLVREMYHAHFIVNKWQFRGIKELSLDHTARIWTSWGLDSGLDSKTHAQVRYLVDMAIQQVESEAHHLCPSSSSTCDLNM